MTIAAGMENRVNSTTIGAQTRPSITALADGGWVVTWQSDGQDGSGIGVYQQAYDAEGGARGGEVQVNTYVAGVQYVPQAMALANGGWVVTWQSSGQDGSGLGVYQQSYNADGTVQGGEIRVNTYAAGNQNLPQIAALADGGWVVAWQSDTQDANYGVYQQVYTADGTARGGEVRVNTYFAGNQSTPQISSLADGGWVVTWLSDGQDGSGYGVYQQPYYADGTPRGGEVQVNTYVTSNQTSAQVASLANGGWVVTWYSLNQDGFDGGIYQQAYRADGTAFGDEGRGTYAPNMTNAPRRLPGSPMAAGW